MTCYFIIQILLQIFGTIRVVTAALVILQHRQIVDKIFRFNGRFQHVIGNSAQNIEPAVQTRTGRDVDQPDARHILNDGIDGIFPFENISDGLRSSVEIPIRIFTLGMLFQQLLLVPVQIVRNIRMRKDRFSRERFPCGIVWKNALYHFPVEAFKTGIVSASKETFEIKTLSASVANPFFTRT